MNIFRFYWIILVALASVACQVDQEKIELWKSTQNGPQKLSQTVVDSGVEPALRASALVALMEIKQHKMLLDALGGLDAKQRDETILALLPTLDKMIAGNGETITNNQLAAKDGLYLIYNFAGPKSLVGVQSALIKWCTEGNFNTRAKAGSFTINVISKRVGKGTAMGLTKQLVVEQAAVLPIAKLIREIGDGPSMVQASKMMAGQLLDKMGKYGETYLTAAAVIGGEPVGEALLKIATNTGINEKLQRYALRAYSVAIDEGNIKGSKSQVAQLVKMATDSNFDKYQREETYMTLAQIKRPEVTPHLFALLDNKSFFWRKVGLRCLLRHDGDQLLEKALSHPKVARNKGEVAEVIDLVAKFPKLASSMVRVARGNNPFGRGVALFALARVGGAAEQEAIVKLKNDHQKLPKGFAAKTVGAAATLAVLEIQQKG